MSLKNQRNSHPCFVGHVCGICVKQGETLGAAGAKACIYNELTILLTFRHRASCILGQAFRYSPENAFYIFNQQIYFIS